MAPVLPRRLPGCRGAELGAQFLRRNSERRSHRGDVQLLGGHEVMPMAWWWGKITGLKTDGETVSDG